MDLWRAGRCYDGIFSDDEMAIGVLRAMSEMGKNVPKDVKIIGFDDVSYASLTTPALTTVHIEMVQLGTEAVQMLVNMVRGHKDVTMVKKLIRARLIIRESA
jgi:DNA-binding LacI/PurR family transcriptional regulator